jgi:hypothetical protein
MAGISGKNLIRVALNSAIPKAVETRSLAAQWLSLVFQGFPAAYGYGFEFGFKNLLIR